MLGMGGAHRTDLVYVRAVVGGWECPGVALVRVHYLVAGMVVLTAGGVLTFEDAATGSLLFRGQQRDG